LIWIKASGRPAFFKLVMPPRRSAPAAIRHCPLCGVAMQASKSRESLQHFDTFQCLTCDTTIVETASAAATRSPDN
jgi:hypothetical protein